MASSSSSSSSSSPPPPPPDESYVAALRRHVRDAVHAVRAAPARLRRDASDVHATVTREAPELAGATLRTAASWTLADLLHTSPVFVFSALLLSARRRRAAARRQLVEPVPWVDWSWFLPRSARTMPGRYAHRLDGIDATRLARQRGISVDEANARKVLGDECVDENIRQGRWRAQHGGGGGDGDAASRGGGGGGDGGDGAMDGGRALNFAEELSREDARRILGVSDVYTEDEVLKRHRKLMFKNHPDNDGSDYLALKVNEAKDVLLSAAPDTAAAAGGAPPPPPSSSSSASKSSRKAKRRRAR